MNYKIYKKQEERGFIALFAMVITITVIGGGALLGSAAIDNVNKQGCGSSFNSWMSGDIYGRLGDANDSEALEEAIKCQKAITDSVKAAKVVAIGMNQTGIIAGGGGKSKSIEFVAELVGGEALNHLGDYVEYASDPNNKPPKKDKSLPKDVKKVVKKKIEIEKEKQKKEKEETKEPSRITKILDDIEKKIQEIDTDDDVNDTGKEWERSDRKEVIDNTQKDDIEQSNAKICPIGFSGTSAPKLKLTKHGDSKPGSRVFFTTEYSDPEGDIRKIVMRTITIIPEYNGRQESQWQTVDFKPSKTCGTEISPLTTLPSDFGSDVEFTMKVEAYLIDATGNKSNITDYTAYYSPGR